MFMRKGNCSLLPFASKRARRSMYVNTKQKCCFTFALQGSQNYQSQAKLVLLHQNTPLADLVRRVQNARSLQFVNKMLKNKIHCSLRFQNKTKIKYYLRLFAICHTIFSTERYVNVDMLKRALECSEKENKKTKQKEQ